MGTIDVERVRAQLKKWQERLLDLTKANPLLGINRSRVTKLRVSEPGAPALFRDFVVGDSTLRMPHVVRVAREHPDEGEEAGEHQYSVEPGDLVFDAKPVDLLRRLRRVSDNARTTVEERGVTTLHLSFGVLKWDDPMLGESVSPLWLVPCQFETFGPSAAMRLSRSDEELQLNPALELYLRERHRVVLPAIPEEPGTEALASFLEEVQAAIREHGWKVEEDIWLSTYSFESLVIYQDLKNMADVALRHNVVIALARASMPPEASEALGEEQLDSLSSSDRLLVPVLPADSSQQKALTLARSGSHLVVHGPPGTGKSQTISNLIADAIGQNKKVLFVSAKMAALNVVYERLARLGLARFCLEAHSSKAGKAKIIDELKRTLGAAAAGADGRFGERLEELTRIRDELNAYVRELHERRGPLGLTLYQVFGRIEKLRCAPDVRAQLPWSDAVAVTRSQLSATLDVLSDLGSQADVFDNRTSHPWRGLKVQPGIPVRREPTEADVETIHASLQKLQANLAKLEPLFGTELSTLSLDDIDVLAPALSEVAAIGWLPTSWASDNVDTLKSKAALLTTAAANAKRLAEDLAKYPTVLKLPAVTARELLGRTATEFGSWHRVFLPSYWLWRSSVLNHLHAGAARDFRALRSYAELASRIVGLETWFDQRRAPLSRESGADGIRDQNTLQTAAKRLSVAAHLRTAIDRIRLRLGDTHSQITDTLRQAAVSVVSSARDAIFRETGSRVSTAWPTGFVDGAGLNAAPVTASLARCQEILGALPKLQEWVVLQHTLAKCNELSLAKFIDALGPLSARAARSAFERRFHTAWANSVIEGSPTLTVFAGVRRQEQVERFHLLDREIRAAALQQTKTIASGLARKIAEATGGAGTASEVGILRRELEKRRRIKPLRRLFAEIPTVLQALKPCMLMSPISVSTFLKPNSISFDLVFFDEASQLPTPEAIPAILRAKQVVVAGDANQLPPTSFFTTSVIFETDGEEADDAEALEPLESLLDDCVAVVPVFEQAHLRWHYRSRDERLIKFSNHYFYKDRPLITFPAVSKTTEDQGVRLVYVPEGVWHRGASRTNRAEARRAAELIVAQLEQRPERSLGVVAMNLTQREAIEDALHELIQDKQELAPLLDTNREEACFIKALENVQGDERDTIIISVGYGKSLEGALSFNFGPLNQEGGWRRLNVLVTRARWQTILITSMRSQELDGANPNNRGAVALRNFIAYAERGCELPPEPTTVTTGETNDFEDAVAEALSERGLRVDQQVGASEYRIDLAIRDPRDPNRYVLGVECDGATYHGARTARDRDLLRQEVLHGLGWRLHRIWSTDWFRDRDKALAGVVNSLKRALEAPVEESVPSGAQVSQSENSTAPNTKPTPDSLAPGAKAAPVPRRYQAGRPYAKYQEKGSRELLLDGSRVQDLVSQVLAIVLHEGPIQKELLVERLKEVNDVGRAGTNVQANIDRAIEIAERRRKLQRVAQEFLLIPGSQLKTFRTSGDGVQRPLDVVSPEEIALAVLYLVEDQFGYQREAIPRAIAGLFGFERAPIGTAEIVGTVIDDLVEKGELAVSGHQVYVA